MKSVRERYGASPLHLLLVLCSFALTLYAGARLLKGDTTRVVIWFVGAAFVHDLVLLPMYTLTDRSVQVLLRGRGRAAPGSRTRTRWINYIRVPVFISLLLLIVWYPLVLGRVPDYTGATALSSGGFLERWLLITAGLFAASALVLLTALLRNRPPKPRRHRAPRPDAPR